MVTDTEKQDAAWKWVKAGWKLNKAEGTWTNPEGQGPFYLNYQTGEMMSEGVADPVPTPEPATKKRLEQAGLRDVTKEEPKPLSHLDRLRYLVENDVVEVFGPTGTGKSRIAAAVAVDAQQRGGKVFYWDTERNLSRGVREALGQNYHYDPRVQGLVDWTNHVEKMPDVDLIVIDSIGYPVLVQYARLNMKQKGDALQRMISVVGALKEWAYLKANRLVLVINQPTSEMGLNEGEEPRPFGHKHAFAAKLILETHLTVQGQVTKGQLRVWRGRDHRKGQGLAAYAISDQGVEIEWLFDAK